MRIGSLFSGVGGLDLAALDLFPGSTVAWHCEKDTAAAKVLAHHWPDIPNLGDVTEIDWGAVEPVSVLCLGFPCQDVSTAGRRAGLGDGTRSGLWSYARDAIEVLRPTWVLIENVKGLLSAPALRRMEPDTTDLGHLGGGPVLRALGAVLGDLADLGFDADWTCVRASEVGACHRRDRVFVLAYPADTPGVGLERVDDRTGQPPSRRGRERHPSGGSRNADGLALLPTPAVADAMGGRAARSGARSNELLLPGVARAHAEGALLPTPRASDGKNGGPNQRGSSGDLMLPSAVHRLLPTPEAKLAHSGPGYARAGRPESGGHDLTTALAIETQWGDYQNAIRHQETLSRPAPSPTEPNTKGRPRLSPAFAEWMMFWPQGWVTDPQIGLSRIEQLRAIGNGVVPPQAYTAFRHLRTLCEVA